MVVVVVVTVVVVVSTVVVVVVTIVVVVGTVVVVVVTRYTCCVEAIDKTRGATSAVGSIPKDMTPQLQALTWLAADTGTGEQYYS